MARSAGLNFLGVMDYFSEFNENYKPSSPQRDMQNGILKFREFLNSLESIHEHQRLTPPLQFPGALATLTLCFTLPRKGLPWWLSGKNLPANAADVGLIPGLGRSLEKELGTHSSVLAWENPWTEEPGGLQFTRWQTQLSN